MTTIGTKYLVDRQGRKKPVVLDIREYSRLVSRLEELEDALDLDETVRTAQEFRDYREIMKDKLEGAETATAMKTCYFCGGKVVIKRIRHVHHWRDELVIFENVPAEVCPQCGETYFSPEVLQMMDRATLEGLPPN